MPDQPVHARRYESVLTSNLQGNRPISAEIAVAPVKQGERAAQDRDAEIGDPRNHGTINESRQSSQNINAGDDPQAGESKSEQPPFTPAEKRLWRS